MMVELGMYELMDFCQQWRREEFARAATECFEWALAHDVEFDLVQNDVESWMIEVALQDSNGRFFAEPVGIRAGMNVNKVFTRAITQARAKRIKKITKREVAARAA